MTDKIVDETDPIFDHDETDLMPELTNAEESIQMQDRNISPWGCDVDFQSRGLSWVVTQVEEGMQCSEHGIEKGWKIIKWNGVLINNTNSAEIESYLRAGNPGTITFRKCKNIWKLYTIMENKLNNDNAEIEE